MVSRMAPPKMSTPRISSYVTLCGQGGQKQLMGRGDCSSSGLEGEMTLGYLGGPKVGMTRGCKGTLWEAEAGGAPQIQGQPT